MGVRPYPTAIWPYGRRRPLIHASVFTPAILQRVLSASVTVDKEVVSSIGKGVLVFAAMAPGDTEKEADSLAAKVLKMKLWGDDAGGQVCTFFLTASNPTTRGDLRVRDF